MCGALEFIEPTKSQPFSRVAIGRRVACIGAGNTAIDVVTAARRLGAEAVYLVYRRSEQEMPAFRYEYELAKKDGVNFLWQTQPVRILGSGGVVTGLECVRTRLGEPDERGKRAPETIPNSTFTIECGYGRARRRAEAGHGLFARRQGNRSSQEWHRRDRRAAPDRQPKIFCGRRLRERRPGSGGRRRGRHGGRARNRRVARAGTGSRAQGVGVRE